MAVPLLLTGAFGQEAGSWVTITSTDGFQLSARYDPAARPGPGVLLLHQCNRSGPETGFETLAPQLAAAGLHALMLDSRGFGRSRDEQYSDYRRQMGRIDARVDDDVEAAFRFLAGREGVDPGRIAVVAASCGSWQAIRLAARHEQVRALVFISGSYLDLDDVSRAYTGLRDRPVLAIFSEDDRYRTPESMRDAFARSRHPASRLIAYKGNLHGAPLFGLDPTLERQIVAWLSARIEHR